MKWYRKINRGFAALILILVILITYRTVLSQSRRQDEPDIKRLTEDYLATAIDLEFIPAELMTAYESAQEPLDEFLAGTAYRDHYNQAKTALAPFYPTDGRYLGFQLNRLESKWRDQLNGGSTIDLGYTLQRFEDLKFLDNGVTVRIQMDYLIEGDSQYSMEDIFFEKVGSEWKIIASNFNTHYLLDWGKW